MAPVAPLKGFDDYETSLGDELRGERATHGKSLLDVQRELHIKAAYIAAIENCDPTVFPNKGFVAGYVRSYARFLGLDSEEIFDRFRAESGFEGVNAELTGKRDKREKRVTKAQAALKGAEIAPKFVGNLTPPKESILGVISPSGIFSVIVLVGLIGGIGFGGWSVLREIQRVEFAPVDQTPGVVAAVAVIDEPTAETAAEAPATDASPAANDALARLYRPQELAVPKLEPRDGPIAALDPDDVGLLRDVPEEVVPVIDVDALIAQALMEGPTADEVDAALAEGPVVTVDNAPPAVELLATRAAWVRVYQADGTILFEKILEADERYQVPPEAEGPLLRAGNSGSVYLLVDNQPYGPVGNGTAVAKEVSLLSDDVLAAMTLVEDLEIGDRQPVATAENQ